MCRSTLELYSIVTVIITHTHTNAHVHTYYMIAHTCMTRIQDRTSTTNFKYRFATTVIQQMAQQCTELAINMVLVHSLLLYSIHKKTPGSCLAVITMQV